MMRSVSFPLVGMALLLSPAVHAAEWVVEGALDPALSYNDNVFMSSSNKSSSFRTHITPTLFFSRTQDNNSQTLNLGYAIDRYTALSSLNRHDPFVRFDSGFQTQRSDWGLAASYVKSSSRSNALNDTGDFRTDATLTTTTVSPSYRYQLTEKDTVLWNATYSQRDYSTRDFSDNTTKSLDAGWQHQFSERLRGGLSAAISNYKSTGLTLTTDNDSYFLSLTADYDMTELWTVGGKVGIRQLHSQWRDSSGTRKRNSSGSSLDITASRQGERNHLTLSISRALVPSSTGDVNETDSARISWSHSLTEVLTTQLGAYYQKTKSASVQTSGNRKNINFSSTLTWQLQRNMGIGFSYRYRQQKQSDVGSNAYSHVIMMTLNYDWDGIRASR